jgi:hypothetical protein
MLRLLYPEGAYDLLFTFSVLESIILSIVMLCHFNRLSL